MTSGGDNKEENTLENSSLEQSSNQKATPSAASVEPELDDFGLPKRPVRASRPAELDDSDDDHDTFHDAEVPTDINGASEEDTKQATCKPHQTAEKPLELVDKSNKQSSPDVASEGGAIFKESKAHKESQVVGEGSGVESKPAENIPPLDTAVKQDEQTEDSPTSPRASRISGTVIPKRNPRSAPATASEWSHQRQIAAATQSDDEDEEEEWQPMPAIDEFDIYDDNGRLVAKGHRETDSDTNAYAGIGGAGKGYTRVQLDEDAQSATSLDEDTNYLFRNGQKMEDIEANADDEQRDAPSQLQATKDLLTEGQRIAYVGVVRLTIHKMFTALGDLEKTKSVRKELVKSLESMDMWGQKMMVRLYTHMDINQAEQIMIEQLAEHGVQPSDLVAPLMLNAKVKNPMADETATETSRPDVSRNRNSATSASSLKGDVSLKEVQEGEEVPEVHGPEDMPHTKEIELDLRWTVLCDLFLVLISDGQYDSRSRRLLERVGSTMDISWIQICRFEKKVIDALEMQEAEAKENWDESENMEKRRVRSLKKKYMVMGLATVGGGLVIGLSAGLLAPFIGAGLAAGFTTIGVTGTAGFLGGVGGAALITSAATAAGGTIAVRAADRRTGSVKTFEYRPLHNNKRLNLILTISGWMTGKVDDVRLPYSTVDPIMGDIYSLLWEPEMLRSMGDTINILATEALTQTVQQVLGSTILITLMASIQLPVVLSKLAYLIDNPWSVSLDRATAAGLILADSLIDRHLGQRPITLLGFSLGSRVIFSCLKELSNRGAYGLVQNVYMFGSPVVANKDEYLRARSVVSGRFLNGYASNDWILGYLFRMTSGGIMRVAGLAPVEGIPGVENVNVSAWVKGHMSYRTAMPRLLREVGWEVESDEFTEIEDPDPENHAARQRELILQIDEARKKAEEKPEKKRFGLFKRGKLAEKQGWERYNVNDTSDRRNPSNTPEPGTNADLNVLFDVDAIRRELASEMIEVRELDSTLPPMQIMSVKDGEKHVEYLRLPPGMKPEEIARLNLPPRPDEIDVSFAPIQQPSAIRPARSSSLRPASIASPQLSPRISPQRSPQRSPDPSRRSSCANSEPRELASTLPALSTTGSASSKPDIYNAPLGPRPELKPHATDSSVPSWGRPSTTSDYTTTPPMPGLDLERNAWADDDEFGQSRGEISMTFE
ncbi:uncharacterized protein A1O5_01249 [Cladophialophora psammophila CBS 110553]|uniref:DUF726 domain protein n=1 Tax=Cladophialophora psammophila CBS 110553 TaxID=1182543 RepID=W9XIF8_9EURO|nr:uncharacterized protein A1O5_01249 [Cladophialophora psammophila CBS 110553]EXJ76741.1 hypothetical protein A1O5_01249 [Cladophialophora psammophila CBS 110553]